MISAGNLEDLILEGSGGDFDFDGLPFFMGEEAPSYRRGDGDLPGRVV